MSAGIRVECGCELHPDHTHGDRLITCAEHGIKYVVRAQEVKSVQYVAERTY